MGRVKICKFVVFIFRRDEVFESLAISCKKSTIRTDTLNRVRKCIARAIDDAFLGDFEISEGHVVHKHRCQGHYFVHRTCCALIFLALKSWYNSRFLLKHDRNELKGWNFKLMELQLSFFFGFSSCFFLRKHVSLPLLSLHSLFA